MPIRALPFLILAAPAFAAPQVVTDLPVTGALVSAVTGDPATVLVEGDADPHHVALRPSEARAMGAADLVVLIDGVAPAYAEAAGTLGAERLVLSDGEAGHGDHEGGHADGEDHDTHGAAHGHDEHDAAHGHDEHGAAHGHDDHGVAHPWLDPAIASDWLEDIATSLSTLDPAMAETYRANARAAQETIAQAASAARDRLAETPPAPMIAVHDAWGHAVRAFDLPVVAAVQDSHAARPGARHLREIEALIHDGAVTCLLAATGEARGSADRFDLPVVTLPLTGLSDTAGIDGYIGLIDAIGALGADCPAP